MQQSPSLTRMPFQVSDRLSVPFCLEGDTRQTPIDLAFSWFGNPHGPLVAVLGGISAGRNVADSGTVRGWWREQAGPGKALDGEQVQILSFDFLGGAGQTTQAAQLAAEHPHFRGWVSTLDQAKLLALLLGELGIPCLDLLIGASYGGMVALRFAQHFPSLAKKLLVLSAGEASVPQAFALRSIQRRLVGLAQLGGQTAEGLNIARQLAMLSYRTPEEINGRFFEGYRPLGEEGSVLSYLEHCGLEFAQRFPADAFLCLSESIDRHRADPGSIHLPTHLVGITSDQLVPPWQIERLAASLAGPCTLELLESMFGHDAFLKETRAISQIISRNLGGLP
jgi:homoserine O-acetyltransferase